MNVHFKVYSRYFYSKLDNESQVIYQRILKEWLEFNKTITFNGINRSVNFKEIFSCLKDDNPELFYINFNSVSVSRSIARTIISVDFYYEKNEIEQRKENIVKTIERLKSNISKSDDREKSIHDFLALNVKYSDDLYVRNAHNICGPLIDGVAVCEGFAYAFKLLCDEMCIPCIVIHGTAHNSNGTTENHSWNIVHHNNNNFHVDVTWDNKSMKYNGTSLYYNVSENYIKNNHTWDVNRWPRCLHCGEFEKKIVTPNTYNSLCESLRKLLISKETQIVIKAFDKINSIESAQVTINKALHGINAPISSYTLTYIDELDCTSVCVEYLK